MEIIDIIWETVPGLSLELNICKNAIFLLSYESNKHCGRLFPSSILEASVKGGVVEGMLFEIWFYRCFIHGESF